MIRPARCQAIRKVNCVSHPQHAIAKRLLVGFGGMVTFELKGGYGDARRFLASLRLFSQATSLGGVESLASMPVNTSHARIPQEDSRKMGITDSMVRLSVGMEDVEDLKGDLDRTLG